MSDCGHGAAGGSPDAAHRPIGWLVALLCLLALTGCRGDRLSAPETLPPTPTRLPATVLPPAATAEPAPPEPTAPPPTAPPTATETETAPPTHTPLPSATPTPLHPLSIESLRAGTYPGSALEIEELLVPGQNYDRFIASYLSDGLRIRGLLTVPRGEAPEAGWPVIVFNHGYIPPEVYRTTERYVAYVDGFARNGYIVFRPDYRGHDQSEGEAVGAYFSTAYTRDVLNAVSSLQEFDGADPDRVGMWGHSMGGHIALQAMVTTDQVKAGVIWAGLMGSYEDLLARWWWRRWGCGEGTPCPEPDSNDDASAQVRALQRMYGSIEENPELWDSISATAYLIDISGPIQLHHGTADATVDVGFSQRLQERMTSLGLPVELHLYAGDNHNISNSFGEAMGRSIEFFDLHLKE